MLNFETNIFVKSFKIMILYIRFQKIRWKEKIYYFFHVKVEFQWNKDNPKRVYTKQKKYFCYFSFCNVSRFKIIFWRIALIWISAKLSEFKLISYPETKYSAMVIVFLEILSFSCISHSLVIKSASKFKTYFK